MTISLSIHARVEGQPGACRKITPKSPDRGNGFKISDNEKQNLQSSGISFEIFKK